MRKLLLVALALALAVSAFAGPDNNSLRVGTTQEPDNLNPWEGSADTKENAMNLFFLGLTYFDNDGVLQPGLAKEVPTLENGLLTISRDADGNFVEQQVTWTLREDAVWSDGTPVTTDDVLFTYEVQKNDLVPSNTKGFTNRIKEVRAEDDKTFTIVYDEPNLFAVNPGGNIGLARFNDVAPKHVWEPIFNQALAGAGEDQESFLDQFLGAAPATAAQGPQVTSGAFVIDDWQPGQFLRGTPNQDFVLGAPKLDFVQVEFFSDQNTLLANILNGTLDASDDIGLAGQDPEVLRGQFDGDVNVAPSGFIEHLNVNQWPECQDAQDLLLDDKRTRQAIIQGIDREALHPIVFPPSILSTSFVVNGDIGYLEGIENEWPHNPEAARALLADLGWEDSDGNGVLDRTTEDGRTVEFNLRHIVTPATFRVQTQEILQQDLAEIGINVVAETGPADVVFAAAHLNRAQECSWPHLFEFAEAAGLGISPFDPLAQQLDPSQLSNAESGFSGSNYSGTIVPSFAELFADAAEAFDNAERAAIVEEMQRIFLDELPFIPLYERAEIVTTKDGLENYRKDTPLAKTIFWNPWEWCWDGVSC